MVGVCESQTREMWIVCVSIWLRDLRRIPFLEVKEGMSKREGTKVQPAELRLAHDDWDCAGFPGRQNNRLGQTFRVPFGHRKPE